MTPSTSLTPLSPPCTHSLQGLVAAFCLAGGAGVSCAAREQAWLLTGELGNRTSGEGQPALRAASE